MKRSGGIAVLGGAALIVSGLAILWWCVDQVRGGGLGFIDPTYTTIFYTMGTVGVGLIVLGILLFIFLKRRVR